MMTERAPKARIARTGRRPHPARNARLISTGAAASLTLGVVAVLTLSDESASSRAPVAKVVEQSSDDLAPISSSANPTPATITVIRRIHHLIDPTTGRSCASDVASVTVLADSCANAEVLAKQFVLLGGDSAEANAGRLGVDALFVGYDGGVHRIGQWERVGP